MNFSYCLDVIFKYFEELFLVINNTHIYNFHKSRFSSHIFPVHRALLICYSIFSEKVIPTKWIEYLVPVDGIHPI